MGEFESARKLFEEGVKYSLKHKLPEVAKYSDYGGMYATQQKYDTALVIYRQGLQHEGIPEEDVIFTKLGIVECLASKGDFDAAYRENLKIEAQLKGPFETAMAEHKLSEFQRSLYENYAVIHIGQKQWREALKWYKIALKTDLDYDLGSGRNAAIFLDNIGKIYLELDQVDSALLSFHKALETILPNFSAPTDQNPTPDMFRAENVIYRSLEGKAQCFERLNLLDKALECYTLIPVVEAKLRAAHDYESSTLEALRESRARIDKAIGITCRLSEDAINEVYTRKAFCLMEQARAIILMEKLSKSRSFDKLPDSLKTREYGLQFEIAWHEQEKAKKLVKGNNFDSVRYEKLDDALFLLKKELGQLKKAFPVYARTVDELQYIHAGEVPALLSPGSALVEYYLNTDATTLFIFCITDTGAITWRCEDWTAERKEQALGLTRFVTWPDESMEAKQKYTRSAAVLYDQLLRPELDSFPAVERLVIIPDEILAFLPFEILLTRPTEATEPYTTLDYLIRKKSICYNYSATLLQLQQQIQQNRHKREPLGAFIPRYSGKATDSLNNTPLHNLDSIQAAVRATLGMLDIPECCQPQPTETAFKNEADRYAILLLGMHGFADEKHPELSRLLFGDPQNKPDSDNILYANELQILHLQADLAILLACQTGTGKLQRGEGVYSLARAFALAGVSSTLMSLWSLPDETAPLMMQVYFEKLNSAVPKDLALQAAKKAYLNADSKYDLTHPFYWAGLMAIGDTRPLELEAASFCACSLTFPGIVGLLLLGGAWWMRRRRAKSH